LLAADVLHVDASWRNEGLRYWVIQNSCETLALVNFGSAPHARASTLFKTDIHNLMSIRA
jgi:hypothetical protein